MADIINHYLPTCGQILDTFGLPLLAVAVKERLECHFYALFCIELFSV